jgi:hypothetical protein
MYYAFIDTNIWIRVMSQGKPGCEIQLFERLRVLAEGDVLTLVIPEVVRLELQGHKRNLSEDLRKKFEDLEKAVDKIPVWSEIEDSKRFMFQQLDSFRKEKAQRWEQMYKDILDFIDSSKVSSIPFTSEIMCRAKKRIIRGGMPKKSSRVDQDAAIVESLASYFSDIQDPQPILFFCSENASDFAIGLDSNNTKDRRFALHPDLAADLPVTHYFTTLSDVLELDKGYESLPPLPENKDILEAREREERLGSEYDFDSDEYLDSLQHLETLCNLQLAQHFIAKIAPNLPEEVRTKRAALVEEIENLLTQCRRFKSWDDRSELKLPSWIDFISEDMIPYTSLSNLLKIRDSLQEYSSIHKGLDEEMK